jgi:hypothetical protein
MTNLNSYSIENYQYKLGDTITIDKDLVKIESIISVNDVVFFFCSKSNGYFVSRVSSDKTIALGITPMPALIFHHYAKSLIANNQ